MRKEITKNSRYYFYDVGIRNAIVGMFNPLSLRDDTKKIWENYVISEIHKIREYQRLSSGFYFWRTYDGQKIDLIEARGKDLMGYEIKWSPSRVRPPKAWRDNYPTAGFELIHRENYLSYILIKQGKI